MNCGNGACVAGRYYLVDTGYALETGYMGPFKNTRYHLDDFRGVDMDTLSRQEKFHHSFEPPQCRRKDIWGSQSLLAHIAWGTVLS